MQTILGANGTIGTVLAKELTAYTSQIRLVSRNPKKVNATDELLPADLTDPTQVEKAIAGSEIVYVVVGFEYALKTWQTVWPPFMRAVIDACKKHRARLVFFDNVYSYDMASISHMTENAPLHPPSKKGAVRKQLVDMIQQEIDHGSLTALIARAADFYGPGNDRSVLVETVAKNLLKDKKADQLISVDHIHTYTFTPDAAKATAILGNTPDAYGQTWHLPTSHEKLTGKQWIELFAREMQVAPKYRVVSMWMLHVLKLFIPIFREFPEMMYQNDRDYYFDSSKFEKRFGFIPTTPQEGVRQTVAFLKKM